MAPAAEAVDERVGGAAAVDPLVASGRGRPVRVAYCLDSMAAAGGTEMNAVRTAEALGRGRVDLTVFAMRAEGPMRARYAGAGVPVVQMPQVSTLVAPHTAWQVLRLARVLRERQIEVVHCHDTYTNWFAGLAARAALIPLLTSKRWIGGHPRHLMLSRVAYRLSTRVLANSEGVRRTVIEADGVPPERVVVVSNFVEPDAFASPTCADVARRRAAWGVAPGATVVGCVARLRPEKGQRTLLRAMVGLLGARPDLALVLVGDGPEEQALRAFAVELGIADRVCFAGHQPNRPNPHAIFDISVLASDHEGFPNSVVEAMAAARPVVASDVGGVPDAVQAGHTGLLTPPGDVGALGAAIGRLLTDRRWAETLGIQGQAFARRHFTVERVMDQLTALYVELAAHGRPRHRSSHT